MMREIASSKTVVSKRRIDVPTTNKTTPLFRIELLLLTIKQNNNLLFHYTQTH